MCINKQLRYVLDQPARAFLLPLAKLKIVRAYNRLVSLCKGRPTQDPTDLEELNRILALSRHPTAINDHLVTLFIETLTFKPRLIVELGVRGGGSTLALAYAAKLSNADMISVDIEDRSGMLPKDILPPDQWTFVQSDDVRFAERFPALYPTLTVDVLFIDTSHTFEHTVKEINSWFPLLSKTCKVFFHDTNQRPLYVRKDKSIGIGWNNRRGVIRALENYFEKSFNEREEFVDFRKGWLIKHFPYCNGFTILERLNHPVDEHGR